MAAAKGRAWEGRRRVCRGRPRRVWTEQKAMMWRNQAAQSRAQGGRDNRGTERRDKVQGKGWKAGGREGACAGDVGLRPIQEPRVRGRLHREGEMESGPKGGGSGSTGKE